MTYLNNVLTNILKLRHKTHSSKNLFKTRFYTKHQLEIEFYVIDNWIFIIWHAFLAILSLANSVFVRDLPLQLVRSRLCYIDASVYLSVFIHPWSVRNIVDKRCVLEQKLLLTGYRNALDLCLEVVSRSCQPLRRQ